MKKEPVKENTNMNETKTKQNEGGKFTNLEFLKQLTKNNPDMIAEMINVYLEETPELIKRMKQNLEKGEWEEVRAAAHSIIPSFSTMGMSEEYAAMAKKIQDDAEKKKNRDEVKDMISKIGRVCENAYAELRQELTVLKEM